MKKPLQSIVGLLLLGLCIYYFIHQYKALSSNPQHKESLDSILDQCVDLWPSFLLANVCMLIAYLVRAHRWQMMLNEANCFWLSLRSISIGYLVQIPLSKLGEVVRIANQRKFSNLPLGKIISTIFIDRLLDTASLLVFIILMFSFNYDLINSKFSEFKNVSLQLTIIFSALLLFIIIIFIFKSYLISFVNSKSFIPTKIKDKIIGFINKLEEGTESLKSIKKISYMVFSSLIIWFCYFLSFYILIHSFHQLAEIESIADIINIFTITSIGSIVPVPGSAGYIIFLDRSLVDIYQIDQGVAFGISFVFYITLLCVFNLLLGGSCILYQMFFNKESNVQ